MAGNSFFKMNDDYKKKDRKDKLPIKFDISMLNMFIGFLYKKSSQITRKSLNNLNELINIVDETLYEDNPKLESRLYFIQRTLKARVELKMENDNIILNYCKKDNNNDCIEEIINNLEMYKKINYEEILYINKAIQDRLQYSFLLNHKDEIYNTIEKFDSGEYDSFQEINNNMLEICSKVIKESRDITVLEDIDTFSLDSQHFETSVTDIVNRLKDPSSILKTGIQCLNKILAPGYRSTRLYIYMGLPAGFKSGILLKSCRDIKLHNKGYKPKKIGKRPTVLMITMENTVEETVERLFNMTVTDDDIRNFTPQEVMDMLREKGEMTLSDDGDIDIMIKFYPNRSIDTSHLYTIIEDLEDDNREVITLVLDYIKRIRPAERAKDEKEELKNVTNELKTLAKNKDMPVITAHQLNRSGAVAVDAAMTSNQEDLARFVGRGNVGSAWEVMENADWCAIINVEKKRATGQYYLTFKRVKIRYRDPNDLGYFNHPFLMGNKIQLMDDIHLDKPLSEETLSSDFEGVDLDKKKGTRNAVEREVIDDDTSLFDFNKAINKKS